MTPATREVLFIQGGGEGTHDEWDDKLVDSLARELGDGYEVRYPRMPGEDDASYATWGPAIRQEIAALDDGAVVVGHSVGGTLLIQAVAERPPEVALAATVLLGAPFVGAGGWPGEEFELPPTSAPSYHPTSRSTCSTGSTTTPSHRLTLTCTPA